MAIVINGSGTVTGISVGGLPDGIVDAGTLATNSVDSAELINGSIDAAHLASGVVGDNTPAFEVYMSANMTSVGAAYTKMVFDSEEFDTDNAFDSTTNYRFTVPAGEGGKYAFHAHMYISGTGGDINDYSQIHIYKNGANIAHNYQHVGGHSDGNSASVILPLVATDYIEFYCQATSSPNNSYTIYTSNNITRTRAYGYKLIGV